MTIMMLLIVLGVFAILGFLVRTSADVRGMQELLKDIRTLLLSGRGDLRGADWLIQASVHQHMGELASGFFTIWEWHEQQWKLKTTLLPHGVDPGLPPDYQGSFEGECVKKWVPGWRV
jgi:hypothetical protein